MLMHICFECRRKVEPGQRVIQNYILNEPPDQLKDLASAPGYLTNMSLQHANCYDVDGPKYNDDGSEIEEPPLKGYIKPSNRSSP